ncbi:MAG: hypothetical protein ABW217_03165 [Polyangiaceae bacterium]
MLTLDATSPWRGIRAEWRARRSLALLATACTSLWSLSACNDDLARVYTARPYQADPGCLDSYVPIAVVYAERLPATCEPTCLLQDDQLYVSTVCAPYPERAELLLPEADADCTAALEALAQDLSCETELDSDSADGGASEEPPAPDAAALDAG